MTHQRIVGARAFPIPTEHQEQCLLLQWAFTQRVTHPELRWLFAIPNQGGKGQGAIMRGRKMRREGLQPGYPDIGLDVARGEFHGARIELKRRRDSRFSADQIKWRDWLTSQGYFWALCFGWERARDVLLDYLSLARDGEAHDGG